jgi:hypothetical protein
VRDKKLVCGDGVFSILYIDVDHIDLDALKTILVFAKQGLPVCMKRSPSQPGKNKSGEYSTLLAELSSLKNFSHEFAGISGVEPLIEGDDLPDFWCRKDGGDLYFFIANPNSRNLHLPLKYGQSLTSRTIQKQVIFRVNGHTGKLVLEFRPYQSLLVKVDKNGHAVLLDIVYNPPVPVKEPF